MKTIEQSIRNRELYQRLETHGHAEIDGWAINADGAEIWLTNPYGIGVGFYADDVGGCTGILERTSTGDHEGEWGTLQYSHSEFKATDTHHGTNAVA